MKYVISLIVGLLLGVVLFVLVLYYNPFVGNPAVSPLAVADVETINLSYSLVPSESIVFTNDGESKLRPHPPKVPQLWEPAVKDTRVLTTMLTDGRGDPVGLGVKFSTDSEKTELINAKALVDSVWHIYLPQHGTFFIDQTENYWAYIRDIVIPAKASSGNNWRGTWYGVMSVGPGALGTARVTGSTGTLANVEAEAVEAVTAKAYSATSGPVAVSGSLTVALSRQAGSR